MRSLARVTRLVGFLSVLFTRTWELQLHPKQETLLKHLSSYEIVTPMRVNDFGEIFPHANHFKRRKRSTLADAIPFRTHYRFRAYGQVFQLNLSADTSFIAPHYTEEHIGATESHLPSDLQHCFYHGYVDAKETHRAVFSLCGGLENIPVLVLVDFVNQR
uniref:Uncharacterized protein n=1 Tax=Sphaerodactylus townsendi TaxID=933632 RepID=A0ACB8FQ87_9SAUR